MMQENRIVISGAVEGIVDEAVLRCLVRHVGAEPGPIHGRNGKQHLLQRLSGYNQAAHIAPWVVLVDLDQDGNCAPPLRTRWLPRPAPRMCFRIAVREVEAWLLADRDRLAPFLGVARTRVPLLPEGVTDPKRAMVELARHSQRRAIQEDMIPRLGSGRTVGPAYASRLIEFVEATWRPDVAAEHADSLRRCCERLSRLAKGVP
jgi:hypothetical protein